MNSPSPGTPVKRDRAAMERLMRLLAYLARAESHGRSARELFEVAGYGDDAKDKGSALARDLRHLREQGWSIENRAPDGAEGQWVMATVDARLRVRLTPGQQAALRRAAVLADRADLGNRLGVRGLDAGEEPRSATRVQVHLDPDLTAVTAAAGAHLLLRFRYKGRDRVVHPIHVVHSNSGWYLRGVEDEALAAPDPAEHAKMFAVQRMSDVEVGAPGSAQVIEGARHQSLHPMSWLVDEPVVAELQTASEFLPDVVHWLGEPESTEPGADGLVVRVRVTNREAFQVRLFQLGTRVRLLGPEPVRTAFLDRLAELAGEA